MVTYNYAETSYMNDPVYLTISLIIAVISIAAMWKIFTKANVPGWGAIIPIYNTYLLFKITFGNGWLFLLLLIPIVNIIALIIADVKLAKAFGKGAGFALGLIFLSFIFLPILGFGSAQYQGAQ